MNKIKEKWGQKMKSFTWKSISGVIKLCERVLADNYRLTERYGSLFYTAMLKRELRLSQMAPGSRVLHIGSGSLPLTAIYLARLGYFVDCVDNDSRAVEKSLLLIKRLSLADIIRVINIEGEDMNYSGYGAVWVSLNIFNKDKVIERIIEKADSDTVIIIREPIRWLRLFYQATDFSEDCAEYFQSGKSTNILSKQSIAIRKKSAKGTNHQTKAGFGSEKSILPEGCDRCYLSSLSIGESCRVFAVPQNCLLPSLGIREGKTLFVGAKGFAEGPLVVRVDNRLVAIDMAIADKIVVGM